MPLKLKARKCKRCRDEFQPVREWQKFCSVKCRSAVAYKERARITRIGQKVIDEQEKGAA